LLPINAAKSVDVKRLNAQTSSPNSADNLFDLRVVFVVNLWVSAVFVNIVVLHAADHHLAVDFSAVYAQEIRSVASRGVYPHGRAWHQPQDHLASPLAGRVRRTVR